ncbi:hypothetical protein HMN09_00776800 [Mycena chlorophos]|uniref:Uncharacterized protein n=1 Tax=Mycena chlorophos TaxID=658473 RepID=A0A8H6WAG5_MYCCL|nr:hypothetical protein HMN09_00776800 [Mycena chlorophos]
MDASAGGDNGIREPDLPPREPAPSPDPPEPCDRAFHRHMTGAIGCGYPLLNPRKASSRPVQLGDVGFLDGDWGFRVLFNLFANDPAREAELRVPSWFEVFPANLKPATVTTHIPPRTSYEAPGVIRRECEPGSMSWDIRAVNGSLLALPHGGSIESFKDPAAIKQLVAPHAKAFYEFFNYRCDLEYTDLLVVTSIARAPTGVVVVNPSQYPPIVGSGPRVDVSWDPADLGSEPRIGPPNTYVSTSSRWCRKPACAPALADSPADADADADADTAIYLNAITIIARSDAERYSGPSPQYAFVSLTELRKKQDNSHCGLRSLLQQICQCIPGYQKRELYIGSGPVTRLAHCDPPVWIAKELFRRHKKLQVVMVATEDWADVGLKHGLADLVKNMELDSRVNLKRVVGKPEVAFLDTCASESRKSVGAGTRLLRLLRAGPGPP